jgi:hypothetical protein
MPRHNPEKRAYKGRSYKKGGKRVRALRDAVDAKLAETKDGIFKPTGA